jgi:hydrophobic/amphiphilic exporter-1 (mainly G- bacteria), HAE1 family
MSLSSFSIERPITTYIMAAVAVLMGAISFYRLPVDLMPESEYPTISVRTGYPGVGPEEIETIISRPMERTLTSAPGVDRIMSTSSEGSSSIRVMFTWGTNLDEAANEIRARIDRVRGTLPPEVEPPTLYKFDASQSPIMFLSLSGDMDPRTLRQFAEDEIQYRIERVPGVAAVDVRGGLKREIHVDLILEKIKALDLSLAQVVSAIRAENMNLPVGPVNEGRYELLIRTQGEFENVDQIRNMVVAVRNGVPVYVKDIAFVDDSWEEVRSLVRIDGRPGIRMSVRKQSGSNTVEVADNVNKELDRINRELPGVSVIATMDSARFIKSAIANVRESAIYGSILAILILFIFLRNVVSTLIITISIPITIIATFALLYYYNFTLNTMSFGGLALGVGMIVDNAIVLLENIFRHREAGKERKEAALIGTREVAMAITASTLTSVAVFVPLIFLTGMSGIMFRQLSYVVIFFQIFSLFMGLTLVPVLCSKYLRVRPVSEARHPMLNHITLAGQRLLDKLDEKYQSGIHWALDHRKSVVLVSVALMAATLPLVPVIGVELMPETDEGEVRVRVEMPTGTRIDATDEVCRRIESLVVREVPETEHIQTEVGGTSFWETSSTHIADIRLTLKDRNERTRSTQEIAAAIRQKLPPMPGILIRTRAGGNRMFRMGNENEDRLSVEVRGFDIREASELANQVKTVMERTPGVVDAQISRREGMPEMLVHIDRDKASLMGLSVAQLANTLRTAVGGTRASVFREGGDEFNIQVRLQERDRNDLNQIAQVPIAAPVLGLEEVRSRSRTLPVSSVIQTERVEGPVSIERRDQERIITVSANLANRDMGSVASDINDGFQNLKIPSNFYLLFGGELEEKERAFRELLFSLILAIALVYAVMAAQFESFRDPLIIMFSIPLAGVGVALALFLTNTVFNMQAFIGLIMLAGIVVNNAIVLIDYTNLLRREYGHSLREAIELGGRRRLRPILMTTLTAILGLIPMAMGFGEGGEVQSPMARVVIGGLTTSTLITLIFIPVLYYIVEHRMERKTG